MDMSHEVVAAMVIQLGMILLGHRSPTREFYTDGWDVFGGHLEPGEQQQQTLVRELREELGITPVEWADLETIEVPLLESEASSEPLIFHLYRVTAWSGEPANLQPHEHDAIQWFSLYQAVRLNLADSNDPRLFARYLSNERNADQA